MDEEIFIMEDNKKLHHYIMMRYCESCWFIAPTYVRWLMGFEPWDHATNYNSQCILALGHSLK